MTGVTKQEKVTKWGHVVTEALGITCNNGTITGKGQVEEKHRSETYKYQKLNWKGNKGHVDKYTYIRLSLMCLEILESIAKVLESSGSLRKGLVGL